MYIKRWRSADIFLIHPILILHQNDDDKSSKKNKKKWKNVLLEKLARKYSIVYGGEFSGLVHQ